MNIEKHTRKKFKVNFYTFLVVKNDIQQQQIFLIKVYS